MAETYASSSYFYSSGDGSPATGHRYSTSSHTEADGTTIVRTARQELGKPPVIEERRYDRTGQEQLALEEPGGTSAGGVKRITDLSDEEMSRGGTPNILSDDNVDRGGWDLSTTPFGMRLFDSKTGAYDEHEDYSTGSGMRHHREVKDVSGRRFRRDVDIDSSGLSKAKEHREFENPSTGRKFERDEEVDVSAIM